MDLSYYDSQDDKVVFPLLLDLYKQCCEQRAALKSEYDKKHSESLLRQLKETSRNSVEIYNKLIKLYNEKEREVC